MHVAGTLQLSADKVIEVEAVVLVVHDVFFLKKLWRLFY